MKEKFAYSPSPEKEVHPNLENLVLADLEWQETNEGSEKERVWTHEQLVSFKGDIVTLKVKKIRKDSTDVFFQEKYEFEFEKDDQVELLYAVLDIDPESAHTTIKKSDPDKKLPKGIGIALYANFIPFIQAKADEFGIDITYKVMELVTISQTPLTSEKWQAIFLPLLDKHDYSKISDDEWWKIYHPKVKTAEASNKEALLSSD